MVNTTTYNVGGVEYCTLYYNNQRFNAVYSDVKSGILSSDQLAAYVKTLWSSALGSSLKRSWTGGVCACMRCRWPSVLWATIPAIWTVPTVPDGKRGA